MSGRAPGGVRWQLAPEGEFWWESDRDCVWRPVGAGATLGLAGAAVADMREAVARAFSSDRRLTGPAPRLARVFGHRRYACCFRLAPAPGIDQAAWAELALATTGFELAAPMNDADPALAVVVCLAQAGGQRVAFEDAWKWLGARIDGLPVSAAHCLVVGR